MSFHTRIKEYEKRIKHNEKKGVQSKEKLSILESQNQELNANLLSLEEKQSEIKSSVDNIQSDIKTQIEGSVKVLQDEIDSLETSTNASLTEISQQLRDDYVKIENLKTLTNEHTTTLAQHNESINGLFENVEAFEGQMSQIFDNQNAQQTDITSLKSDLISVQNLQTNLLSTVSQNSSTILENTLVIDENASDIRSCENAITNLQAVTETQAEEILLIEDRVGVLENSSDVGDLDSLSSYTERDILRLQMLNFDANEPTYWLTQDKIDKLVISSKYSTGGKGRVLTRVAPNSNFKGKIRVYMDLPNGVSDIVASFLVNGHGSESTYALSLNSDYVLEFEFDFIATSAFQEFKFEINDSRFANIVLDYLEIIVENGKNYLLLSLDNSFNASISKVSRVNATYVTQTKGSLGYYSIRDLELPPYTDLVEISDLVYDYNIRRFVAGITGANGSIQTARKGVWIGGENDTLYSGNLTSTISPIEYMSNVYDVRFVNYTNVNTQFFNLCVVTNDYQIYYGQYPENSSYNEKTWLTTFKLGSVDLPSEFISCVGVAFFGFATQSNSWTLGYFLTHRSGRIFYAESEQPQKLIDLGLGSQVHACLSAGQKRIHVFMQQNDNIVERVLYSMEDKTAYTITKWRLLEASKVYPNTKQILQADDQNYFKQSQDGTWEIISLENWDDAFLGMESE